jgi:hypothetical protein
LLKFVPGREQVDEPVTRLTGAILATTGLAVLLTQLVFWPGVITYDAALMYNSIATHRLGDWQSPVMATLWALVDPVAPGSGSIFLIIALSYWAAFGLLALKLAPRGAAWAMAVFLAALTPPAFAFIGVVWRDMLFANSWLLAAGLALAGADQTRRSRHAFGVAALVLVALGVLLRPNAVIAAPLLATYVLWPLCFDWRRALVLFVPMLFAFAALIPLIYYGFFHAERQHPHHAIMVFDLGGITHFTGANQFPVAWTAQETALLLERCYEPQHWDAYWYLEPCRFVMDRLEREHLFGTPRLAAAWASAVASHPLAYFRHRLTYTGTFVAGMKSAAWLNDIRAPTQPAYPDNPYFMALKKVHDSLQGTILFRVGWWLLVCVIACALAWRRRHAPAGAFVIGVCGSAVVYLATFSFVGVATDFRYAYWAVFAGLVGPILLLAVPSGSAGEVLEGRRRPRENDCGAMITTAEPGNHRRDSKP